MTKGELDWIIHDIINKEGKYASISDNEEIEKLVKEAVDKYIKENNKQPQNSL